MADDKVFHPTEIEETPFPMGESVDQSVTESVGKDTYSPRVIKESSMPVRKVAYELLSSVLNTRSKKILGEFQFTELGALQIGKYTSGVSGDLRITPNGFVGRNAAGETKIAFDVETGNLIVAGEIRSGSTVTGSVEIIQDGHILLYGDDGLPSIFIGEL